MTLNEMSILKNGNLRIASVEHGILTLTRWKVRPLNLIDLKDFREKKSIEITFTDLSVLEDGTITKITVSAQLPNILKAYCIVPGGWLPIGFGMLKTIVFADRNFIKEISSTFKNNTPQKEELNGWFDDLRHFKFKIDIIPYAMESNTQQFPTKEEMSDQITEAKGKLLRAAPGVPITEYQGITIEDYAWKQLNHLKPIITKRMSFLTEAANFIKPSSSTETILERWESISKIARKHELNTDIILLLALISVSSPQKDSPGLGIIKISQPYLPKHAYNACLDISQIERLINYWKRDKSNQYTIITSDVALAQLGALLNELEDKSSNGVQAKYLTKIPQELIGNNDPVLHTALKKLMNGGVIDGLESPNTDRKLSD